jgi:hypothetical protein
MKSKIKENLSWIYFLISIKTKIKYNNQYNNKIKIKKTIFWIKYWKIRFKKFKTLLKQSHQSLNKHLHLITVDIKKNKLKNKKVKTSKKSRKFKQKNKKMSPWIYNYPNCTQLLKIHCKTTYIFKSNCTHFVFFQNIFAIKFKSKNMKYKE